MGKAVMGKVVMEIRPQIAELLQEMSLQTQMDVSVERRNEIMVNPKIPRLNAISLFIARDLPTATDRIKMDDLVPSLPTTPPASARSAARPSLDSSSEP